MQVITAIYLNCRPDLRDEWLAGIEVDDVYDAQVCHCFVSGIHGSSFTNCNRRLRSRPFVTLCSFVRSSRRLRILLGRLTAMYRQ